MKLAALGSGAEGVPKTHSPTLNMLCIIQAIMLQRQQPCTKHSWHSYGPSSCLQWCELSSRNITFPPQPALHRLDDELVAYELVVVAEFELEARLNRKLTMIVIAQEESPYEENSYCMLRRSAMPWKLVIGTYTLASEAERARCPMRSSSAPPSRSTSSWPWLPTSPPEPEAPLPAPPLPPPAGAAPLLMPGSGRADHGPADCPAAVLPSPAAGPAPGEGAADWAAAPVA